MAFFREMDKNRSSLLDIIQEAMCDDREYVGLKALKNSDVLAGISILAGDIASSPLFLQNTDGTSQYDEEMHYLLNIKPNNITNAYAFKFAMVVHAITCGNAYALIKRFKDKPIAFEFLFPSEVILEQGENTGDIYYRVNNLYHRDELYPAADILHWRFFTTDSVSGRSPLLSLTDEIGMQENGTKTLRNFFKKGMNSGVLKVLNGKLNVGSKKKVREEFEKIQYSGDTANTTLVLDATMDYKPLEVDSKVLELIHSNNFSTAQIAKALMIPAYKLGVNSPNQSVSQLNTDYVTNSLNYYFSAITGECNVKLLPYKDRFTKMYRFNTDRILQSDRQSYVKMMTDMKNAGVVTTNEMREKIGLPKIKTPEADKLLASLNYTFLDTLENYQEARLKGGDQSG